MSGYWSLVLHSHLPYVHHPEHRYFLEEHWLFEAMSETYIPMLMMLKNLEAEGVYTRLTTSVTPPLAEMLDNENLKGKYIDYLNRTIELCSKEVERTRGNPYFHPLATMYLDRFSHIKDFFINVLGYNVLSGYKYFQDKGVLSIITCGATHGFLPFMTENSARAQIEIACQIHHKHFGRSPSGIWLPECAYYAGVETILKEFGIEYFFVDSHGILYAEPRPRYGTYAPVYTANGVAVFGRDHYSSKQVWSSKEGYPGDYNYRDFYRDAGYDLDYEYIKPYISPDGQRVFTGLKYHKITGDNDYKEAYNRNAALDTARQHAAHFVSERVIQIGNVSEFMDRPPLIVSPYDAELFGHWWFEGPDFLGNVFRELQNSNIQPATPDEYLRKFPVNQVVQVNPSSWGAKGYYGVWLNRGNDWIYKHIRFMADHMEILANKYKGENDGFKVRCLNQMSRELLLAQSSDWAFLITTGTAPQYSIVRTKEHISSFMKLYSMVEDNNYDYGYLEYLEKKDDYFPELNFSVYASIK